MRITAVLISMVVGSLASIAAMSGDHGLSVEGVKVARVDPDPSGTGRKIMLHLDVRGCGEISVTCDCARPHPRLQIRRKSITPAKMSPELAIVTDRWRTIYEDSIESALEGCGLRTIEYEWVPNIWVGSKKSGRYTLSVLPPKLGHRPFVVEATSFDSRGDYGPGSFVTDIVDYREVQVRQ